jgi:hypothetical protein
MHNKIAAVAICIAALAMSAAAQNTFPASGNVGIGTTNPTEAPLVIVDALGKSTFNGAGMTVNRSLAYVGTAAAGQVFNIQTDNFRVVNQANTTTWLNVINGNVGIGTTSPPARFTVGPYASSTTHSVVLSQSWDTTTGYANFVGSWDSPGWWGIGALNNGANYTLQIGNLDTGAQGTGTWSATQHLNLVVGGNVGIGTTNPGSKLEVNGNVAISGTGAGLYFPGNSTPQTVPWTGTVCGGDYAESVDVTGDRTKYEPGDVLVIDPDVSGKFLKSAEPYSTSVTGIYSTKPGTVGRRQTTPKSDAEVPMAMIGIVPTKVSVENGPIHRGDLLVSSSTIGYAMKGTDRSRLTGAVIGKALDNLESGKGVIEVVVTLQ